MFDSGEVGGGEARPVPQQVPPVTVPVHRLARYLRGRLQVTDVPPVEPEVTEYRRHTLPCDECGARTTARLPPGVGSSAFAPRLKAMLAMSSAVYRLSRRTVESLMADFFNVDISLGSVSACEKTVSEAVAAPVAEAREYVEKAAVAHAGATGYRHPPAEGGPPKKGWLWASVTPLVTVFLVHAKHSAARSSVFAKSRPSQTGSSKCALIGTPHAAQLS